MSATTAVTHRPLSRTRSRSKCRRGRRRDPDHGWPGANATITGTTISGNHVASTNVGGDAQANSGGLDEDGSLLLVDSRVDHNTVRVSVPPSSGNLASASFGGIQVTGVATIRNSSISHNVLTAVSATGPAIAAGGGIGNLSGQVTLDRALVIGNRVSADGAIALPFLVGGGTNGGGILNIVFGGGQPVLTISDSVVTANELTTTTDVTPLGGGSLQLPTSSPATRSPSRAPAP